MMKVPDISKYAILEKNSSLKVMSKIQIVFAFDIFMTLSPISLLTTSGDNISAHLF